MWTRYWMSTLCSNRLAFSGYSVEVGLIVGWQTTIKSVDETWWKNSSVGIYLAVSVLVKLPLQTGKCDRWVKNKGNKTMLPGLRTHFHQSFLLLQALSPTSRGLSPSSRQKAHANVRELSWHWSASFTPPGASKAMTSATVDGWKTAACGFPSATPGSAVGASLRQGCAHWDSPTRWCIYTVHTAIGSPKLNPNRLLSASPQSSVSLRKNIQEAQISVHSIQLDSPTVLSKKHQSYR